MPLGLGSNLSRAISKPITPGIVTDNLVLKHQYNASSVVPCSDGAAFFDGTDDYINCGSDSSIDIGTSALSVTFWAYLNVVETLTFVGKGPSIASTTDGTSGWAISLYGSNANLYFDVNTGNDPAERDVVYTSTNSITANRWYHIAVVVPASGDDGRKIYIDGVDKTSVSQHVNTDLGDASVDLWFGDVPTGGTRELNGYMCNVGIWKGTVLTQPQIKSIMNKNYAGLTDSEKTNLVSWWNLDASYSSSDGDTNVVFDNHHSGGESLGSEMVIDGSFNNNATSWTTNTSNDSVVSISNNAATVTNSGTTGYGSIQQASTDFVDGNYYKLTFDVTALTTSDSVTVYNYNSNLTKTLESITTPVTITDYFLASNTDGVDIRAICSNGESITIDNISVKQVNGNTGTLS
jgi:hypothetical protein